MATSCREQAHRGRVRVRPHVEMGLVGAHTAARHPPLPRKRACPAQTQKGTTECRQGLCRDPCRPPEAWSWCRPAEMTPYCCEEEGIADSVAIEVVHCCVVDSHNCIVLQQCAGGYPARVSGTSAPPGLSPAMLERPDSRACTRHVLMTMSSTQNLRR